MRKSQGEKCGLDDYVCSMKTVFYFTDKETELEKLFQRSGLNSAPATY